MSKYQNLEEGLTDLMNRMKEDNPTWPEELTVMYFSRVTALENLMFMCKDNQLNHNAWTNFLQESAYAAWVDGVTEGLLPEADKEQEEHMASMRHPTMTRISKHVGEQFESLVDFYDMDMDDAKKMLGFVYDCTLA